jgi:abortive infection bacteriophage resistance protein
VSTRDFRKNKEYHPQCYGITNQEKNTLFVVILILKSLLSFHTLQVKYDWNLFMDNLEEILSDNRSILDYHLNGLSENWKSGLIIETD